MLSSFLLSASVLSLLCFGSAEEYTVQSISVFPASQGCTFKVDIIPADDFSYFDITYSTKGATPNNLVSHEPGSYTSRRRCYTSTAIYHPNRFARARPLRMDMLGSAKLGTGLTATIETNLVWGHMQAMTNFTVAKIQGPKNGMFAHNATITNRAHATSCEFSKYGQRSEIESLAKYTEPSLVSTLVITGSDAGTLVENAELRHRIYVEWLEGCGSYLQWYDCVTYDRFDNPSVLGGCNPKNGTKPGEVDWTRPPPSSSLLV